MSMNDLNSVKTRLVRAIGSISNSDTRLLLLDMLKNIEELQNELTSLRASGCGQVCPGEDPEPGAKRGRKPSRSDGKGSETPRDA